MRTVGISPKVIAALLTSVATLLVTKLGLQWDPAFEQVISAAAVLLAAYFAPAGAVQDTTGLGSDELLDPAVAKKLQDT